MNGISDEFQKPIRPIGEQEQDHFRVPPIEADKHIKEGKGRPRSPEEKREATFYTVVLDFLKKTYQLLSKSNEKKQSPEDLKNLLLTDLALIKKLLQLLEEKDQSENSQFSEQLSLQWLNLIDHLHQVRLLKLEVGFPLNNLDQLIHNIMHYPGDQEHNLGYYLTEHAGMEWLPFPYMEMLRKLHRDFVNHPEGSDLKEWISLLTK